MHQKHHQSLGPHVHGEATWQYNEAYHKQYLHSTFNFLTCHRFNQVRLGPAIGIGAVSNERGEDPDQPIHPNIESEDDDWMHSTPFQPPWAKYHFLLFSVLFLSYISVMCYSSMCVCVWRRMSDANNKCFSWPDAIWYRNSIRKTRYK